MDAEGQLIERIAKIVARKPAGGRARELKVGLGDDAAVVASRHGKELIFTCDSYFEGVHFLAEVHPAESAGYKSLARAVSDIVAMGGAPRWFLLALGLPQERTGSWLKRFSSGMAKAARELEVNLIGGDTSRVAKISVTITVIGEISRGNAILRSGARPGDSIYVSGRLGEAQLGLEWVRRGLEIRGGKNRLLRQHLYPRIPVALGEWLAEEGIPSAMMDVSDGVSSDLARLCEKSGAGARIEVARLPCVEIPADLRGALGRARLDPLEMALHGGDDYVLLFTVPRRKVGRLRRAPGYRGLTRIGEITRSREMVLVEADGKTRRLAPGGWDPFRH